MTGYDELYYRFFKAAVFAYMSWGDCYNANDLVRREYCERWLTESRTWSRAAGSVRSYVTPGRVTQLEGSVMGGRFKLGPCGGSWEVCLVTSAKPL